MLAVSRYLTTCPLAIFPLLRDRCSSGRRQGCHGSHPSAASTGSQRPCRVGSVLGGLCLGWALSWVAASHRSAPSATPPPLPMHSRASLFVVSAHRGWPGQMTKNQRSGTPIAPWMYITVLVFWNEAESLQLPAALGAGDVLGRGAFRMGSPPPSNSYFLMNAPSPVTKKNPPKHLKTIPLGYYVQSGKAYHRAEMSKGNLMSLTLRSSS